MKAVTLYTKNEALRRRIELILRGCAEVAVGVPDEPSHNLAIIDRETVEDAELIGIELPSEPISHEWLISAVNNGTVQNGRRITHNPSSREVSLGEKSVTLTEVEYRLFAALMSRQGFISREELSQTVWGEHESGLLNVYVHYLREKLEKNGEKIIISSRREGYKIDEKYERSTVC